MPASPDFLAAILERKRREVDRRKRRRRVLEQALSVAAPPRPQPAQAALRREGSRPRVIAEIKFQSPSAGTIRPRAAGDVASLAQTYVGAGASAVSVLADGPGFGGTPLDVRRAAQSVSEPVLFKEFVLDEIQVQLARVMGASLVLLLVRALEDGRLRDLVRSVRAHGMEPVVEAASGEELDRALRSEAAIIGVNARDLQTFRVDVEQAQRHVDRIPPDHIAVFMSGVSGSEDFARLARGRADAVLVGEALMRAREPGGVLRAMTSDVPDRAPA